jgi:hypoxanthine phosphoribosyltransferase
VSGYAAAPHERDKEPQRIMATKPKSKPQPVKVKSKSPRKPAAASVRHLSEGVELDEFSAAGGLPVDSMPGQDRSGARKAIRELSWAEFDRQVQGLAAAAARSFKPDAVVGLVHGGVFVGGAIASALKVEFFPVRVTRRSRDTDSQAASDIPRELKGRRVLVVDDISSTGDSLEFALKLARARGVKTLATAALVSRPGGYEPDHTAFSSDQFFVFPWDYAPLVNDARFSTEGDAAPSKGPKARRRA